MRGTRVAHPAKLAAKVRLLLASQDYFHVHVPRFRWRVLQSWVSTSRKFFVMPASCVYSSWYCDVVNGVKGCCKTGRTCGTDNDNVVCTNTGYVPCTGENFCCREPLPSRNPCLIPFQRWLFTCSPPSSRRLPVFPRHNWNPQMSLDNRDQHANRLWKRFLLHSKANQHLDRQHQLWGHFEDLLQSLQYRTVTRLDR